MIPNFSIAIAVTIGCRTHSMTTLNGGKKLVCFVVAVSHSLNKFLINDWSAILLCLPCIIFHEYMCGFCCLRNFGVLHLVFATRFSGCYEIWLSHEQNNIFLINDWSSIPCIIFHKYADFPVCRTLVFCYEISTPQTRKSGKNLHRS